MVAVRCSAATAGKVGAVQLTAYEGPELARSYTVSIGFLHEGCGSCSVLRMSNLGISAPG